VGVGLAVLRDLRTTSASSAFEHLRLLLILLFLFVIPEGNPRFVTLTESLALAAASLTAVSGATVAYAALSPASQLFGPTLIHGDDPNCAALTYDDGPNHAATPALLDLLAAHHTHATFFLIGRFVDQNPELVRRIHAAGHLIGNHTQTHPWLAWQSARVIREELRACNQAIEDVIGAPVRYFRPPHGARRPAVLRIAQEFGLTPVQWNAMADDWKPIGIGRMLARLDHDLLRCRKRGVGANILLHDGFDQFMGADRSDTLSVTAHLLDRFAANGTRTVTVDTWA
jgi:peptidoglycan/xylan/chitin deacetylase (PgdA/CDA1 family)